MPKITLSEEQIEIVDRIVDNCEKLAIEENPDARLEVKKGSKGGHGLYKSEYCEVLVEKAMHGKLLTKIATEDFHVSSRTVRNWTLHYPAFSHAYDIARDIIITRLTESAEENLGNRNYNHRILELLLMTFRQTEERRCIAPGSLAGDTLEERLTTLLKRANDGEIRPDEFKMLADAIKTVWEVQFGIDIGDKVEELKKQLLESQAKSVTKKTKLEKTLEKK